MATIFPLILGMADMLARGFLLAMLCGAVFLWMLHKAAASTWRLRSLQPAPAPPPLRPAPLRPQPYRMRSAPGQRDH
ncbi:MAG: hypothetical protein MUF01_02455 [Bryobacterales bacterium]|jgi:hypothetical protein|nr:hypothetical protein [Bryobacterales bacterium]